MADIETSIGIGLDTSNALAAIKNLQREISAFHTALAKGSSTAAAAAANLQKDLINNLNATGQFSASMTRITSSTEAFTTSLERNKFSMGEYFRYAGASTKTFGRNFAREFDTIEKVARERVKDLQTQYIKLGRDANGALQAIKVRPLLLDMEDLGTKTQIAAQKQQIFNQLLNQGSTNLLNFGKNTQWAGRQLMVGFTIPLSIFATTAAKTFMELEKQAIKFKRVYGELFTTTEETDAMVKSLQELSLEFTKYGVAVEKTMGLAADAAAMGKTGVDLLAQVTEANRLAVLGNVEQSQALETTISVTNAFGIAAEDLAKKIDFLNAVENQTVTSIEDLTIAIPKAAPVIKQLGGNVEDLAFFLTAMKEGGINASEGANALKSGLASIINPTAKASEFLKGFGINLQSIVDANKGDVKGLVIDFAQALDVLDPLNRAQAIEQLFGKFQFSRLSTLFQNVIAEGTQAERVLALTNATVSDLAALSNKELGSVADSTTFKFQKAVEELRAAIAPVGEQFLKAVTPILEFAVDILNKFNSLNEGVKNFVVVGGALVAGLGPVFLMTFGLIANGVANIIKGFAAVRGWFLKTKDSSSVLGEQFDYMTQAQLEAAAVASSLERVHEKLEQRFTSEKVAVQNLISVYEKAASAKSRFSTVPGVSPQPTGMKLASGIVSVPGPKGAGDIVPAVLSPGEAVIPADAAQKYAPIIKGMIAGNLPGFNKGVMLGMPRSGKSTQKNRDASEQIYQQFLKSSYANVPPTEYGHQLAQTSGHSFPIFGLGGVYMGPNGKRVFVKPVMDERSALAEMRATQIARQAHGLKAPEQRIVVMRDPYDVKKQRRFLALESALDATFVNEDPLAVFNESQYFKQLVASLLRVDKDLSASNVFGDVVADVGPAGVFSRASGVRDYADNLPSMEQQAMINLLGIKGGAKKAFAQATASLMANLTPQQYHQKMVAEIQQVLPLLKQTISSFGLTDKTEIKVYQDMVSRLEQGLTVDWSKFHAIHSQVKPAQPDKASLAEGLPAFSRGGIVSQKDMEVFKRYVGGIKERPAGNFYGTNDPTIAALTPAAQKRYYKAIEDDDEEKAFGIIAQGLLANPVADFAGKGRGIKNEHWMNLPDLTNSKQQNIKRISYAPENMDSMLSDLSSLINFAEGEDPQEVARIQKLREIVAQAQQNKVPLSAGERAALLDFFAVHRSSESKIKAKPMGQYSSQVNAFGGGPLAGPGTYFAGTTKQSDQMWDDYAGSNLFRMDYSDDVLGKVLKSKGYLENTDVLAEELWAFAQKNPKFAKDHVIASQKDAKKRAQDGFFDSQTTPQDKFIRHLRSIGYLGHAFSPGEIVSWAVGEDGIGLKPFKSNTGIIGYANGGLIRGPGTGKSDSIIARVSNGEAVIPAKSVAQNLGLVKSLISGNAPVPGYENGVVSVPGPKGKGDVVPAMLSPGEAVIPADMAKKYGALINGMIAGNIPGYSRGLGTAAKAYGAPGSRATSKTVNASHVAGMESKNLAATMLAIAEVDEEFGELEVEVVELVPVLDEFGNQLTRIVEKVSKKTGEVKQVVEELFDDVKTVKKVKDLDPAKEFMVQGYGFGGTAIPELQLRNKDAYQAAGISGASFTLQQSIDAGKKAEAALTARRNQLSEEVIQQLELLVREGQESQRLQESENAATADLTYSKNVAATAIEFAINQDTSSNLSPEQARAEAEQRTAAVLMQYEKDLQEGMDAEDALDTARLRLQKAMITASERIDTGIIRLTSSASEGAARDLLRMYNTKGPKAIKSSSSRQLINRDQNNVSRGRDAAAASVRMASVGAEGIQDVYENMIAVSAPSTAALAAAQEAGKSGAFKIHKATIDGIKQGLGINSPSKVYQEITNAVNAGAMSAIDDASRAGTAIGGAVAAGAQAEMGKATVYKLPGLRRVTTDVNVYLAEMEAFTKKQQAMFDRIKQQHASLGQSFQSYFASISSQAGPAFNVKTREQVDPNAGRMGFERINQAAMQVSFAFSSIASVTSMFGADMGAVNEALFGMSNALFAVTAVTGLLSAAMQSATVAAAKKAAADSIGSLTGLFSGGFINGFKTIGTKLSGFGKGLATAVPWIGKLASGFVRFIPIIGAVATAFTIFKIIGDIQEQQKQKIEGMGNAAFAAGEKLKGLASYAGFTPTRDPGSRFEETSAAAGTGITQQEAAKAVEIGQTEEFKTDIAEGGKFYNDVQNIKKATVEEAQVALQALFVQLLALAPEGTDPATIKATIAAIAEAAGKGDVSLELPVKLDPFTAGNEKAVIDYVKGLQDIVPEAQIFGGTFKNKDEVLAQAKTFGSAATAGLEQLNTQFGAGLLTAKQYRDSVGEVTGSIAALEPVAANVAAQKVFENYGVPPEVYNGITDLESQLALIEALAAGAAIDPKIYEALAAASDEENATAQEKNAGRAAEAELNRIINKTLRDQIQLIEDKAEADNAAQATQDLTLMQEQIDGLKETKTLLPEVTTLLGSEAEAYRFLADEKYKNLLLDAKKKDEGTGATANVDALIASYKELNGLQAENNLDAYIADLEEEDTLKKQLEAAGFDAAEAQDILNNSTYKAAAMAAAASGDWQDFIDKMNKIEELTPNTTGGGTPDKTPMEQAVEQLKEQRKEILNTNTAYSKLRQAGISVGKAFKIAQDPILAAALAAEKVGTKKWKELVALINKVNASNVAAELRSLTNDNRAEAAATKNIGLIEKHLTKLGYSAEQIDRVISQIGDNPDILQKFVSDMKDGKINAESIRNYLASIKNIKVELTIEDMESQIDGAFSDIQSGFSAQREVINLDFEMGTNVSGKNKINPLTGLPYNTNEINKQIRIAEQYISERQYAIDDYEYQLSGIEEKETAINESYDKRIEALDKVQSLNEKISQGQQDQLSVANALASGDIAAAAEAAQQMQANQAAKALEDQKAAIEAARAAELAGVRSANGLSRIEIEEKIKTLKTEIAKKEEEILEPQSRALELAEDYRDAANDSVTYLGRNESEWKKIENGVRLARTEAEGYKKAITDALALIPQLNSAYGSTGATNKVDKGKLDALNQKIANAERYKSNMQAQGRWAEFAGATAKLDQYYAERKKILGLASGGSVAGPGTSTSDSIPAMLSDGEFVVRASSVDKLGTRFLNYINENGKLPGFAAGGSVTEKTKDLNSRLAGAQERLRKLQQDPYYSAQRAVIIQAQINRTMAALHKLADPKNERMQERLNILMGGNTSSAVAKYQRETYYKSKPQNQQPATQGPASQQPSTQSPNMRGTYVFDPKTKKWVLQPSTRTTRTPSFTRGSFKGNLNQLLGGRSSLPGMFPRNTPFRFAAGGSVNKPKPGDPGFYRPRNTSEAIGLGMQMVMDNITRGLFGQAGANARRGVRSTAGDLVDSAATVALNALPFPALRGARAAGQGLDTAAARAAAAVILRNQRTAQVTSEISLKSILADRQIKNAFQVGAKSPKSQYFDGMRMVENRTLGIPVDAPASARPVYQYLTSGVTVPYSLLKMLPPKTRNVLSTTNLQNPATASLFGGNSPVVLSFKGKKPGATFTVGDSAYAGSNVPRFPLSANRTSIDALLNRSNAKFIETQTPATLDLFSQMGKPTKATSTLFGRTQNNRPNLSQFLLSKMLGKPRNPVPPRNPSGLAMGGLVKPKYFNAGGLARGTDIVPSMLTPGEFVMSKYAVKNYGVDTMRAMNSGTLNEGSVYNYSVNVSVQSNANPDQIARAVMTQIRQIDSQRIRSSNF